MTFIECHNLVKIYKVADLEVVALQGIDLRINKGEMLAIIGASGSGKSTLMNIIGGLDTPSAGRVIVGEHDLTQMKPRETVLYRRQEIGFVWQQTGRNLIPYLTALQNVELPMALNGVGAKERRQGASELLKEVGLANRLHHRPDRLSGGQQQRVAIAVAMANRPAVLLADEPTGQVDSASAEVILDAMTRLRYTYGVTIVIVTHDVSVAERVHRVIGMRDGRTTTEILRNYGEDGTENHEKEYAILDRSGRVQLPQEFLDALTLDERVELQLRDDHIGVYPDSNAHPGETK